jgi:sugar lactone lactonase YvrE
MTCWYDDLDRAHREGKVLTVAPGRPVRWSIRVGCRKELTHVERYTAEPCSDEPLELGECARWDGATQELLWVDAPTGRLFGAGFSDGRLDIRFTHQIAGFLTAVAPLAAPHGGWIVAAREGFGHLAADGALTMLAEPEADHAGQVRMNDGACDPAGRFWAGSTGGDDAPGSAALYRYDGDGRYARMLTDVTISNGIGWSPDGTLMYYVDSPSQVISVFDYDLGTATIAGRRTLAVVDPADGVPDGLCVDAEGYLWVAIWGCGQVRRYAPDGTQVAVAEVPARQASCCALGGPEGRHLFITTARDGLPRETLVAEPDTGRVFVTEVPVPGPAVRPCTTPVP